MKRVILVSGGIDSYCAWHHYNSYHGSVNIPVFIYYNQAYAEKEIAACRELYDDFTILKVGYVTRSQTKNNPFIPCRNLTFASSVAMSFEPDEIVISGLRDDNVVDKSPRAFKEMSAFISEHSNFQVNITSPFFKKSKGEVVADFLKNNGSVDKLLMCVSCYEASEGHCNDCPACFRRFVALASNGIPCSRPSSRVIQEYLKNIHKYDPDRQSRIFIALKSIGYKVIAVDIDGILTNETDGCSYENRTPNADTINELRKLFMKESNLIVLYTARLESDRMVTEQWLNANHVKYSSLIMNKVPFNILFDDSSKARL